MFLLKGRKGRLRSVTFSADGRTLLTVDGHSAFAWDLASRTRLWATSGVQVYEARFTPDERAVLTVAVYGIYPALWDARTGQRLELPAALRERGVLRSLTFSPTDRTAGGSRRRGRCGFICTRSSHCARCGRSPSARRRMSDVDL